jgi:hypothetical protein
VKDRANNLHHVAAKIILFLLPRGQPRPRFSTGAPRFKRDPSASAMETSDRDEKP